MFREMAALTLAVGVGLVAPSSAQAKGEGPMRLTKALLVDLDPEKRGTEKVPSLDRYFDYDHMVMEPIRPHRRHFSRSQIKRYDAMFRELLSIAPHISSGGALSRLDYTLEGPKLESSKAHVTMDAFDPEEDIETTVIFHWEKKKGVWRIFDVSFDGASLVKDYQNQFGRIIKKEGSDALLKRLEARIAREREKRV